MDARDLARRVHRFLATLPDGSAVEVIFYAHLGIGLFAIGGLLFAGAGLAWSVAAGVGSFVVLMLMMLHRYTLWVAALLGTALASGYCGLIGWAIGSMTKIASGALLGAAVGVALGFWVAATSYASFLRSRNRRHSPS
jgi:hypothetical protein